MAIKNRIIINDGFNPELAIGAQLTGALEIPVISPATSLVAPKYLVPFSKRKLASNPTKTFLMFYENDDNFADVIKNPDRYISEFSEFAGVIAPDDSLYRDMPLACQLCNIYRSRLIGSYLQRHGINVIGNCRWGDERTYTANTFGEPVAFVGLPKNNIIAVGTYGCIRGAENKKHFKKGLREMIKFLQPKTLIVYGAMPEEVFGEFRQKTEFIKFNDWTSIRRGGMKNG